MLQKGVSEEKHQNFKAETSEAKDAESLFWKRRLDSKDD